MHYLDVRKKRSRNEFEEDIDRVLEWNQRNLLENPRCWWRLEIQDEEPILSGNNIKAFPKDIAALDKFYKETSNRWAKAKMKSKEPWAYWD